MECVFACIPACMGLGMWMAAFCGTGRVRGVGGAESIDLLETLAHQTYVPATQASRESGAGAGLTDDD